MKFRYCLYCKKPVTKQNFRSRHLHADVVSATTESTANGVTGSKRKHQQIADVDSVGTDQASNDQGERIHEDEDAGHPKDVVLVTKVRENNGGGTSPNKIFASEKVSLEAEALSSHFSTAIVSRAVEIMQDDERMELQGKDSKSQVLHQGNCGSFLLIDPVTCHDPGTTKLQKGEKTGSCTNPHDETCSTMRESKGFSLDLLVESRDRANTACYELQIRHRRRLWLALFSQRPQALGMGIDNWLSQVLAVSDPARSWNIESDKVDAADWRSSATSDELDWTRQLEPTSSQLTKWLGLLGTRPETSVEGSKATAWLKRVLEVSCQDFEADDSTKNEAERRILKTSILPLEKT